MKKKYYYAEIKKGPYKKQKTKGLLLTQAELYKARARAKKSGFDKK